MNKSLNSTALSPSTVTVARLADLRRQFRQHGIAACLIDDTDAHLSEYPPERFKGRSYVSGFTGSAGTLLVTENAAALWTDSRYFLQAEAQLADTGILLMKQRMEGVPSPEAWLGGQLPFGAVLGVNARCLSVSRSRQLSDALKVWNISLRDVGDLLETMWGNRPLMPSAPVMEHELRYAGLSRTEKIARIRAELAKCDADAAIITALDDVAWTFNLRGADVPCNPVFIAFAVITDDMAQLYIDAAKLPLPLQTTLTQEHIVLRPYEHIYADVAKLTGRVMLAPDTANQTLQASLQTPTIIEQLSPPTILKAQKTDTELQHIRRTMLYDGAAMVNFLFWLDQTVGNVPVTDCEIAEKLNWFRSLQPGCCGVSFETIVGHDAAGAIVHRIARPDNALPVMRQGLLLFDSGGQYLSGTTDITRTVALSSPTPQQKRDFTLVLKGLIGLSMAVFPANTPGCNLDILARRPMWEHGINYGHGTGHGIGYFLNVHEGPMSIRQEYNKITLAPGMVLSNEPGIYREGQYGIRIENMMCCIPKTETEFGRFLAFETLTLCPIDRSLIDFSMLSSAETEWLDSYHARCRAELSPLLTSEVQAFLERLI
ncbi:MAG: aminopeptidase P family protein [Bacteroidales bacterium]|jgi:Xaa-Pro aminopeptidase|nr:aminopeptidase P family protein [Bacteroidales bacterium]